MGNIGRSEAASHFRGAERDSSQFDLRWNRDRRSAAYDRRRLLRACLLSLEGRANSRQGLARTGATEDNPVLIRIHFDRPELLQRHVVLGNQPDAHVVRGTGSRSIAGSCPPASDSTPVSFFLRLRSASAADSLAASCCN